MKKAALISALLLVLPMIFSFFVFAESKAAPVYPLLIDGMSSLTGVSSERATITKTRYLPENENLSFGEGDDGFTTVRRDVYSFGDVLELKKSFSENVDLYRYSELIFDYDITAVIGADSDLDTDDISYSITVTLFSGTEKYSLPIQAFGGGVQTASIPLSSWRSRGEITGISVSVSAACDSSEKISLSLSVDGIRADGVADTAVEDTFMTSVFSTSGGGSVYDRDRNVITWGITSSGSSITGAAVFEDRADAAKHNTMRIVLTSNEDITLKLLASYRDGTGMIGDEIKIESGDSIREFYFELPDAGEINTFTFTASGAIGTVIDIYNIDTLEMPPEKSGETEIFGALDSVSVKPDGSINLRGTVPADIVSEHLGGRLLVYAVPLYHDIENITDLASPIAEADMTTRFNITVSEAKLPDGALAMRYIVTVSDGGEHIIIGEPRMPRSDGIGVTVPNRSKSIKGLASPYLSAADCAGVTELTVDLSSLFSEAASGRIYSAFGRLFYFNTDYLKEIDAKIKSISLSSTDVYIRLVLSVKDEKGRITGYKAVCADTETDFQTLAAASEFITGRYRSIESGFICGIILGNSDADERDLSAPYEYALSMVKAAAAVYGIGSANINGFRVLLPFGDVLTAPVLEKRGDAKLLLSFISEYAPDHQLDSYGIIWQTDSEREPWSVGVDGLSPLKEFISSLGGSKPSCIFVEHTENGYYYDSAVMLADYMKSYYAAVKDGAVTSFIYKFSSLPQEKLWREFISYFTLLDTDLSYLASEYVKNETETVFELSDTLKNRAYPYAYAETEAFNKAPAEVKGTYELFGYADSFDTGGWFSAEKSGECVTLKTGTGRAMRAVGEIMYSSVTPLDLSAVSVIAVDSYSNKKSEYEMILYSQSGVFRASFSSSGRSVSYIDISDYAGIDSVYGILIKPKTEGSTLYVKSISVKSFLYSDSELSERYISGSASSDGVRQTEENLVEILAVIFGVIVATAFAVALMRRKK